MGFFGGPRRSVIQDLDYGSEDPRPTVFVDGAGNPVLLDPPESDFFGEADASARGSSLDDPWLTAAQESEEPTTRLGIDVIGNGYQVSGLLAIGRFERLSDWLNMQQGWIPVEEGVLFHPGSEEPGASKPRSNQWIRLDQVVLVCEKPREQSQRQSPLAVQKTRRRVTMVTTGYTLRGYVHVHEAGSMQQFLETPDPRFIPMTDVVVRWLTDETIVGHKPFALVNRDQLISVSEEQLRDEDEAAGDGQRAGTSPDEDRESIEEYRYFPRSA